VAYVSFGDVERLETAALKALLLEGEPSERVWAAWALGLRHDQTFARDLRATAAEEPHAGVRRHLVVILAGAGEMRSVLTMAAHDPDERVRATALQYVARLAQPRDADATEILARTLAEGTPLLRLGCIAGLRADAPAVLWSGAEACVSSSDRDLRWTAYETVIRHGAVARAASELARDFMKVEPEPSARLNALRLLHGQVGAAALCALLDDVALDAALVPEVVEALHAHGVQRDWVDVERLLARFPDAGRLHRVLQLLVVGAEGGARGALLGLFVAGRLVPERSWEMREEILIRLRRALDDNRGPLDESERQLRQALADWVEKAATEARADPDLADEVDEDFDPCGDEREILARLAALDVH